MDCFFSRFKIAQKVLVAGFLSFLMGSMAMAGNRCPSSEEHALSAVRYQLFTAFHMGYDGYETPCDIQCMGRSECKSECQNNKGLELLSQKMGELHSKKQLAKTCDSYLSVCVEQCQALGKPCHSACQVKSRL